MINRHTFSKFNNQIYFSGHLLCFSLQNAPLYTRYVAWLSPFSFLFDATYLKCADKILTLYPEPSDHLTFLALHLGMLQSQYTWSCLAVNVETFEQRITLLKRTSGPHILKSQQRHLFWWKSFMFLLYSFVAFFKTTALLCLNNFTLNYFFDLKRFQTSKVKTSNLDSCAYRRWLLSNKNAVSQKKCMQGLLNDIEYVTFYF